ncbi:MAG: putative DCC family thiol-disulfide oxidoreductase YuxK [Halioglobus sp.]|jgi:predicted DCC family thiol-disulfide oxidoreductase YuxK
MSHDTLYYDGRCPLCSTEIKKLQLHAHDTLQLVDIHSLTDGADLPDKQLLLSELHLKLADGEFLKGLEANVAAWQHTRFGFFYRWLGWPLVRSVAEWVYSRWAKVRYRRLYGDKGAI